MPSRVNKAPYLTDKHFKCIQLRMATTGTQMHPAGFFFSTRRPIRTHRMARTGYTVLASCKSVRTHSGEVGPDEACTEAR